MAMTKVTSRSPDDMSDKEMAVCLGMDALRILLGLPTHNFTASQVIEALQLCAGAQPSKGEKE